MSWGLGWKRPSEVFHLTLSYGADADTLDDVTPASSRSSSSASPFFGSSPTSTVQDVVATAASVDNDREKLGFRIDLDWNAGDNEDQIALKLQSQVVVALPSPQDSVEIELREKGGVPVTENEVDSLENGGGDLGSNGGGKSGNSAVKKREPLKGIILWRTGGSGQQNDGAIGVLLKLMKSNVANGFVDGVVLGSGCLEHWRNVAVVSLCSLGFTCAALVELSLEHNKLVRPLLDFRAMAELRVLRLFGNPLEFLPDILNFAICLSQT